MSYTEKFEDLITDTGGCGRFQWIVALLIQTAKVSPAWSMLAMTYMGQQPDFHCDLPAVNQTWDNGTQPLSTCDVANMSGCPAYVYESSMDTIVNKFDLVCDRKWIVATITTIQMSGVLVGCLVSGQLGDVIGRKPTYFMSLLILFVFNIVAYFSSSWPMYAAIRFIIGIGIAFFLTTQFNVMTEFMPTVWRARAISVPFWSFECGIFAIVAWLLKDWRNVHLATAGVTLPFLFSYCIIPESSRWLITKERYSDAEEVIHKVSKLNGKPEPDLSKFLAQAQEEIKSAGKKVTYSILDLFKTKERIKLTLGLFFTWLTVSYAYYGLTFGIQSLAGDLYLNMFLMNIIDVPASFTTMFLVNRFGRKYTCMVFFGITGLAGLIVGIVQYIDTPSRPVVTNVFALMSKMTIGISWGALVVFTTELYPTVVRSVSYGLQNTAARVGGMIAPQIVFLNDDIPGLLYFLSAGMMLISAGIFCLYPETNGRVLNDTFDQNVAVNIETPREEKEPIDKYYGDTKL